MTWGRKFWVAAVGVPTFLTIAAAWLSPYWLPLPARFLAAGDTIEPADAIVVLSGLASERAPAAAALYKQGYAPLVITLGGRIDPLSKALGEALTDAQLNARVAERQGVPQGAILAISKGQRTWEEAQALRDYLRTSPARSLILVTSGFGARRVRWTFSRVLDGSVPKLMVLSVQPPEMDASNWWQTGKGALTLLTEFVKFSYYVIHYGPLGKAP